MKQNVLIVDDEPDIRELLEITLSRMELETYSAFDLNSARALLKKHDFHLCLTDMRLPDGDGLDLVSDIQKHYPHLPVAVITAHGSTETAIQALKSGAFDFVSKPVDLIKLRTLVNTALKLSHSYPTEDSQNNSTVSISGNSLLIRNLKQQITKLSRSQAPVFIYGESGSGKELVARAIHEQGPRADKEFIAINCGAIPSELMESEFFGHKKGSFTGADTDKLGLFQAAHEGSLFLDEIADLPLSMQVKLLRAIQEKTIRPVGSQTEIPVDIRLLSATHKNLAEAVKEGTFRQDLYYRINVIELNTPSLRSRPEDISDLIEFFLNKIADEQNQNKYHISSTAKAALENYDFPGNVRELENILYRACALAENEIIETISLPDSRSQITESQVSGSAEHTLDELTKNLAENPDFSLEKYLENIEKEAITSALELTRWNRTAAARKLGMSFRSFRYRLKKLGID